VENQWCLFGFDVDRKAIRTFVLSRPSKPTLTGKRFTVSGKFDLNEHLKGSMGLYRGQEDYEVVIELDAWAADDVRGRRLHSSQELVELGAGKLRVRLRLNSLEEVERWVLSFGAHATVVQPPKLRQRIGGTAAELVTRYAPMDLDHGPLTGGNGGNGGGGREDRGPWTIDHRLGKTGTTGRQDYGTTGQQDG